MLQKREEAIYFLLSEQQHMHKIFSTLTFQELLANKHHKLRDFTFGRVTAWETKNECHAIDNAFFLNKSHNERFTLSTANFQRLGFPLALTQTLQALASSCLPQQIFNFSSKLLSRFEKTAKGFASVAQKHQK